MYGEICPIRASGEVMKSKSVLSTVPVVLLTAVLVAADPAIGGPQDNQQSKEVAATSTEKTSTAGCGLLPRSLLEKMLGQAFEDEPMETKAPPAYDGAWGTSCRFSPKPPFTRGHQTTVDFVIYVESSAAAAKRTFDQAGVVLADKTKPKPSGLGDEAYWGITEDEPSMLHVLKGKTHYSLELEPANDSKLLELAAAVSGKL
jgi:hypothetical protein